MSVRRIQIRRDTFQNFSNLNVTLHQGELGLDISNKRIKVGDGFTDWNQLGYVEDAGLESIRQEYGDEDTFELFFDLHK